MFIESKVVPTKAYTVEVLNDVDGDKCLTLWVERVHALVVCIEKGQILEVKAQSDPSSESNWDYFIDDDFSVTRGSGAVFSICNSSTIQALKEICQDIKNNIESAKESRFDGYKSVGFSLGSYDKSYRISIGCAK